MSTRYERHKQLTEMLTSDLTPISRRTARCVNCQELYEPNVGAWAKDGYYVPTGEMCAWCIELRNEMLALGLEETDESEGDDDGRSRHAIN